MKFVLTLHNVTKPVSSKNSLRLTVKHRVGAGPVEPADAIYSPCLLLPSRRFVFAITDAFRNTM